MENKKFLKIYLPILFLVILFAGIGIFNAAMNDMVGYNFCVSKGMVFIKNPIAIGKILIVKCRTSVDTKVLCFDIENDEEVECAKN